MTRKLYYEDCHLSTFSATVTSCRMDEGRWQIVLDATAFYPEGGGQACDLGTLAEVQVLDVTENGTDVIHWCSGALEVGRTVTGSIDIGRRFDLMQQHTGEHIVSGIINRRYGYHNVGFHMGADVITIDFDGVIPSADLPAIELEANQALWQNLPVRCWYPTPEELPNVVYRTKRQLPWPVRIVQIPGYDSCACCGVHVASTGEVGLVKLFTAVGLRGGTRMEMACGQRALEMLNAAYDQNRQVSQAFSAKITETGAAAQKMNEQLGLAKAEASALRRRIFQTIAQQYAGSHNAVCFEPDLEPVMVRELADRIADGITGTACVFSGADETGYNYCLVSRNVDLRDFGKQLVQLLGGRGGGKASFQQGKLRASRHEIEAFVCSMQQ